MHLPGRQQHSGASQRSATDRFVEGHGRSFLCVGTKADRLSGNERVKAKLRLQQGLELEDLLLCSTKTGYGIKELWAQILERTGPK